MRNVYQIYFGFIFLTNLKPRIHGHLKQNSKFSPLNNLYIISFSSTSSSSSYYYYY